MNKLRPVEYLAIVVIRCNCCLTIAVSKFQIQNHEIGNKFNGTSLLDKLTKINMSLPLDEKCSAQFMAAPWSLFKINCRIHLGCDMVLVCWHWLAVI